MKSRTMSATPFEGLLLLLLLTVSQALLAVAAGISFPHSNSQACVQRDPLMDPTYELRYGVDVIWQIPPHPRGVLLMTHGGGMDALSYFDPGPQCELCYGLPEQRTAVLEALRRGYAVIAVKSLGYTYDINWPIDTSKDLVIVTNVMTEWRREHALEGLPLVVWGHSAGTMLASALTQRLPMQAMVLMCGEGITNVFKMPNPVPFPPIFFAYMPVDSEGVNITGKDADTMAILTKRGVPVAETQCWPKPLFPLYFTEHILGMSDDMSRKIFAAYEAAGWLDSDGYLTINPSETDWKSVLLDALPFCVASEDPCRLAHVAQELKSAFAMHSFTSDADDVIFPWLDSTLFSSLGQALDAAI